MRLSVNVMNGRDNMDGLKEVALVVVNALKEKGIEVKYSEGENFIDMSWDDGNGE